MERMEAHDRLRLARQRKFPDGPQQAAEYFGWNPNTYRAHENGQRGLKNDAAVRYARAFGVPVGWLVFGEASSAPVTTDAAPAATHALPVAIIRKAVHLLNREGLLGGGDPEQTADEFIAFCQWVEQQEERGNKQEQVRENAAAVISYLKSRLGVSDAVARPARSVQKPAETKAN